MSEDATRHLGLFLQCAAEIDFVWMGLQRDRRGGHAIGRLVSTVARDCDVPLILIGARRGRRTMQSRPPQPSRSQT